MKPQAQYGNALPDAAPVLHCAPHPGYAADFVIADAA